ncbi:cytochrome b5 domain-containing protein [Clostridium sp. YIM B02569]|uniref:cytochrome b5 domain-containing protein n=1 Tax=Clostridium sp. YIM B02569 TaxID=2911967 RepID=UPI001EE9E753|nr:cytochrome b5 domain-containing protein [Clostridium sp. YIM B02569]
MTSYFEYRTISELLENDYNFHRQQKRFTLDQLSKYDGENGKIAYVSIEGLVYDTRNDSIFKEIKDIGIIAGKDLTEQFDFYYRMNHIINKIPKIRYLQD